MQTYIKHKYQFLKDLLHSFVIFSFSLCKHPTEFPYTEIIDSNHDLTFFVKNTYFELRYIT